MARRPSSWRDVVTVNPNRPRYRPGGLGRYESASPRRSRGSGGERSRGRSRRDNTDELMDNLRRVGKKDDDGGFIDKLADVGKGALGGVFAALDTARAGTSAIGTELAEEAGKRLNELGVGRESRREIAEERAEGSGESYGFSVADVIKKTRGRESLTKQTKLEQEEGFKKLPPLARAGTTFALDVVTDPVSYIAPQAKLDDVAKVARELDNVGEAAAAARVLKARTASVLSSEELAKIGATGGIYARVPGTGVVGRTLGIDRLLQKTGVPMREASLVSRESKVGRAAAATSRAAHRPIARTLNSKPAQSLVRWGFAGSKPQLKAALRSGNPDEAVPALWTVTKEAQGRYVAHGFESKWGKPLQKILRDAKKDNVQPRDLLYAAGRDADATLRAGEHGQRVVKFLDEVGLDANAVAGSEFLRIHEDYMPRFLNDELLAARRAGASERTLETIVKKRKYGTADGELNEIFDEQLVPQAAHPKGWSIERQMDAAAYRAGLSPSPRKSFLYKDDAYEVLPLYLKKLSRQVGRENTATELKKVGVGLDLFQDMRGPRGLDDTVQRMNGERRLSQSRRATAEQQTPAELEEWAMRLDEAADNHQRALSAWLSGNQPLEGSDALVAKTVVEQASGELSELLQRHAALVRHRDSVLAAIEDAYDVAARSGGELPDEIEDLRAALDQAESLLDDLNATVGGVNVDDEVATLAAIDEKLASPDLDEGQRAIGQSLRAATQSKIRAAEELVADPASRTAVNSLREERDEILETLEAPINETNVSPEERAVADTTLGGEPLSPKESDIRARFEASTDPEEQVDLGIAGQITRLESQADSAAAGLGDPIDGRKAVKVLQGNEDAVRMVLQNGYRQFGANTQLPEQLVEQLTQAGRVGWDNGQGALRLYDNVQNLWKAYAVATPGFHFRNSFGGIFNNYLAGVNHIKPYARYHRLARAAEKGTLDKFSPELQEAWRALERSGIAGTGQTAYEIEHRLFAPLSANPLSTDFAPLRASRRVGEGVENHLRGTLFLDEYLKNGGNVDEAFSKVMKFHFDYEDLSQVERSVIRRLVPFYTWTRRNLPLQLEQIAKNPAKMNRYWQAKRALESTSEEEGVVPPYYQDLWAIRLPFGTPTEEGGSGQMYLTPDLPETQLGEIMDPGMLIGQGTPLIKTPIEYWAGKQFFKDLPLSDEYEPAPGVFQAVPGLMQGMQLLGRAERNADGDWMLKERDAYAIGQYLPLLSQARRVLPTEDRYEDRRMSSMLSYFFGTGVRTNTESEQQKVLWQRYYELDDQIKKAEQLGHIDPEDNYTVQDILDAS